MIFLTTYRENSFQNAFISTDCQWTFLATHISQSGHEIVFFTRLFYKEINEVEGWTKEKLTYLHLMLQICWFYVVFCIFVVSFCHIYQLENRLWKLWFAATCMTVWLTDLSVKYSHTSHVFLCFISLISWIWSRREQQGRGSIHQPASGGKINVRLYSYRPVVLSACLLVCLNCSNRFRFEIEAFCRWFCVCVWIRSRWSCWAGLKSSWLCTIKSTAVRMVSDWISFIPRMDIVSHSCQSCRFLNMFS